MKNNNVSIIKCIDYDYERVYRAISLAVEKAGGFPDIQNKTVLLKPNLLYPVAPEKAVTTHPAVLNAVIRLVKEKNPLRVIVGDSPGVAHMDTAGKKSGLKEIAERNDVEWIEFNNPTLLENNNGKIQKQFFPASVVVESDVIITIPKLKTHEMMYYTGAMKNLFGTIPGLNKSRFHFNFPEKDDFASMIVDLNIALKSSYAIMDAVVAMEGPGPGSGYPKELGLVLASPNLLALDITAAELIGYNPLAVPILKIAMENGYWLNSLSEIRQTGENPEDVKPESFQLVKVLKDTGFIKKIAPEFIFKIIKNFFVPRPFFSKNKCIACGRCIEICPADALEFKIGKNRKSVSVDYNKCIRCYCCHEVCPVDAIRIAKI
jgi:uncharacterized protein (DUF362 family)/NAD-dependent dihydropyrimidine dehydrogenase PreA subunit